MAELTDDGTTWPTNPTPQANPPAADPYGGYLIPKILANLYQTAKSGFTLPGDVLTGKASMNDPATQARVGDMSSLFMGGASTAPAENDALNAGFRVYHGSPHSFDRFDMSKIGSGEGNQAYGHGLYFADSENTARSYRDQLAPYADVDFKGEPLDPLTMKQTLTNAGINPRTGAVNIAYSRMRRSNSWDDYLSKLNDIDLSKLSRFESMLNDVRQEKSLAELLSQTPATSLISRPNPGHMYEAEIDADPNKFLHWDYPMSDQTPGVADALADLAVQWALPMGNAEGGRAYKDLAASTSGASASQALLDRGIPGVKYLDQGSRRAALKGASESDLSHNYVMFDDKPITILRHYNAAGVPGLLGQLAAPENQ